MRSIHNTHTHMYTYILDTQLGLHTQGNDDQEIKFTQYIAQ